MGKGEIGEYTERERGGSEGENTGRLPYRAESRTSCRLSTAVLRSVSGPQAPWRVNSSEIQLPKPPGTMRVAHRAYKEFRRSDISGPMTVTDVQVTSAARMIPGHERLRPGLPKLLSNSERLFPTHTPESPFLTLSH